MADAARVAVVGVSPRPICGVRDHATLLAGALEREGVECKWQWLQSSDADGLAAQRARMRTWTRELRRELAAERPDAIVLHYSVFAHSYRGLPLFVAPMMSALRAGGAPIVTVMHELVFPWGQGGARGAVWAVTQRAALVDVVRSSRALVLTADFRVDWLRARRWLPSRPVALAPVFSNLPAPAAAPPPGRQTPVAGLFGFTLDTPTVELVADAVKLLRERGVGMRLALLGAPGPDTPAAEVWRTVAVTRGVEDALSFSGKLPAQELSNALGECDVLLYADIMGLGSRKGTLAASLASGRPLLALEGRRLWSALMDAQAAKLVARTPLALADGLQALLGDARERALLGESARAFAQSEMSVERTAEAVLGFVRDAAQPGRAAAHAERARS